MRRVMTVWALDQLFVALDAKSGYSVRKTEDPASPPSNTARNLEWYFRKNGRPGHSGRRCFMMKCKGLFLVRKVDGAVCRHEH